MISVILAHGGSAGLALELGLVLIVLVPGVILGVVAWRLGNRAPTEEDEKP